MPGPLVGLIFHCYILIDGVKDRSIAFHPAASSGSGSSLCLGA